MSDTGMAAVPDDPAELTRHIERRCHARHREQLPELAAMAARDEALHADAPQVPAGLDRLRMLTGGFAAPADACRTRTVLYAGLRDFAADLEEHVRLENDVLFPPFETPGGGA